MNKNKTDCFVAPDFENHSPSTWYQAALQQPTFMYDTAQAKAIEYLDKLWADLMMFKRKRNRFLGRSLRSPKLPKGLYLYGEVGRGKSFLMDIFFGCLPYNRKRRVHFHAFMAEIHHRLQLHKSEVDPLQAVAAEIGKETRVLCFDEFHVSDIADAMILGQLLNHLFNEEVVLVITSNYAPSELYPQGLNRSSFLSTIELIKEKLTVLNIEGKKDYRLRNVNFDQTFFVPVNAENEQKLSQLLTEMTGCKPGSEEYISINGRQLSCEAKTKTAIWFDFQMLCGEPRSQMDYLYLAKHYQMLLISGIKKLSASESDEARRLTWLIDVLYDYRVKLFATSEVNVEDIFIEGDFVNEFQRTVSRIIEMQSEQYLHQPHLTLVKIQ